MSADIFGFLANFQGGGARPNRYEVMLTFPKTLADTAVGQKISFTCKASSIPAMNMGEAIAPYKGRQVKVPGDTVFDDWSVTCLVDNDFKGKTIFEEWLNLMNGWESNTTATGFMSPTAIFGNGTIKQLDREDNVIATYQVQGIFPKVVGEISLGYNTNDTIMEQPVTFAVNSLKSDKSR